MSDFDKEAERQRLREKYEKDTERREETQRMSELLLQGATMTNSHCNECGTPIFRYQGTEFCPNCQHKQASAAAEQADAAAAKVAEGQAEANGATTQQATADGRADAEGTNGSAAAAPDATGAAPSSAEAESPQAASQSGTGAPAPLSTEGQTSEPTPERETATADATPQPATADATGASMGAARESLLDAVTHHARRATATDEPRRAKQHLEAAREAAEALDALGR